MGKRKADVDPSRPKGKITAYAFFIRHKHEVKDAAMSSLPFSEFSKKCSTEWKESSEEQRQPFLDQATMDKERFDRETSVWKANGGQTRERAKKRATKDVNEPKKPQTAFFLFSQEYRDQIKTNNPDFKVTDVARELGRMWREANDETKSYFAKSAEEKKAEYKKEMEEYTHNKKIEQEKQQKEQQQRQRQLAQQQRQQAKQATQQQQQQQHQIQHQQIQVQQQRLAPAVQPRIQYVQAAPAQQQQQVHQVYYQQATTSQPQQQRQQHTTIHAAPQQQYYQYQ